VVRQDGRPGDLRREPPRVEEFTVARPSGSGGAPANPPARQVRDGLEVVERVMQKYRPVSVPGLPRFTGGAIGFIGYEFIHDVEPVVPRTADR